VSLAVCSAFGLAVAGPRLESAHRWRETLPHVGQFLFGVRELVVAAPLRPLIELLDEGERLVHCLFRGRQDADDTAEQCVRHRNLFR
jgi:hypothetical protein